jgi:ribonuclease P protein component
MRAEPRAASASHSDGCGSKQRFAYRLRLHGAADFEAVLRAPRGTDSAGRRRQGRGRWFAVAARPNGLEYSRLGIVAARRAVASAVQRNRQKRLIRETFRTRISSVPALDVVVRVLQAAPNGRERRDARVELERLLDQVMVMR